MLEGLLKGKVALITGAARGIGKAIAMKLASAGADIAFTDLKEDDNFRNTVAEISALGVQCRGYASNAADFAEAHATVDQIQKDFGHIDILVNNAGINLRKPVAELDDATWQKMLDTNLTSVFHVSQAAFPMLRAHGGKVINLCSLMSEIARPTVSPYASTKGAVRQFTRALATEWAQYNIQVNGIAPGFIATDMNIPLMQDKELNDYIIRHTPAKRWGKPSEVASVVAFLSSSASNFVNGQIIFIDGGFIISL